MKKLILIVLIFSSASVFATPTSDLAAFADQLDSCGDYDYLCANPIMVKLLRAEEKIVNDQLADIDSTCASLHDIKTLLSVKNSVLDIKTQFKIQKTDHDKRVAQLKGAFFENYRTFNAHNDYTLFLDSIILSTQKLLAKIKK
jgi:hypothetical protein